MSPIRILIADDHTLMRQGLRQLCEGLGGFTVVAEAEDGSQAVALARTTQPDVILMDIVMPDVDGVAAIRQIMAESPAARIIALTMYRQEQYMLDAIRAGARGYLLKTVDARDLIAAIEAVQRGEYLIDPLVASRVLSELHLDMPESPRIEPLTEGEMASCAWWPRGWTTRRLLRLLAIPSTPWPTGCAPFTRSCTSPTALRPRSMPCARAGPRWTSRRGKRRLSVAARRSPSLLPSFTVCSPHYI